MEVHADARGCTRMRVSLSAGGSTGLAGWVGGLAVCRGRPVWGNGARRCECACTVHAGEGPSQPSCPDRLGKPGANQKAMQGHLVYL